MVLSQPQMPARRLFLFKLRRLAAAFLMLSATACSDSTSAPKAPLAPTVTTPTPPTPANHNPVITSISVTTMAVSGLTPVVMSAGATDEDGDALSYAWTFAGQTAATANVNTTLTGDGAVSVTLTVTDARGGTVSATRSVTLATMSGRWNMVYANGNACGPFGLSTPPVLTLIQNGRQVTGTLSSPGAWCNVPGGTSGGIDPASPGEIDADGNVKMRIKVGAFNDSLITARMDGTTGREVTGSVVYQDSGNRSTLSLKKL